MKRLLFTCSIASVAVALMAGCALPLKDEPLKQVLRPLATDEFNRSEPEKLPDEIEDVQKIPQDVRIFADSITTPVSPDEQALAVQDFRKRFFSPWTSLEPLYSIGEAIQGMKDIGQKVWYGENRLKVTPQRIKKIQTHAALDRLPSMNKPGIVIAPTSMRGLPNLKPMYETPDDFPFDQLQYTEVKPNEPLRILHESDTGAWVFVETSYGLGWVKADTVKIAGESLRQRMMTAELVVIVRDFAVIRDKNGRALPQPKIGTLYPLVKEEQDHWLIDVAVAGEEDQAALKTARISKKDAGRFPLPFSATGVTHVGNELLKTPYGWGELFRDRDCSATTRDFFLPFGIWLPRNSRQQINSGQPVSLANLSKADKEKLLQERGVPFRTLLHRKGHIMLYVGLMNEKPVILHNTWAIRFKTRGGQEEKFYIGRTVLTTLEAGDEFPLSRGTLLDHLDGMLHLPVKQERNDTL